MLTVCPTCKGMCWVHSPLTAIHVIRPLSQSTTFCSCGEPNCTDCNGTGVMGRKRTCYGFRDGKGLDWEKRKEGRRMRQEVLR